MSNNHPNDKKISPEIQAIPTTVETIKINGQHKPFHSGMRELMKIALSWPKRFSKSA